MGLLFSFFLAIQQDRGLCGQQTKERLEKNNVTFFFTCLSAVKFKF